MDLFPTHHQARRTDPSNSKKAARQNGTGRNSARVLLLRAYTLHGELTDAEAGERAGVQTAHKRCSELLRAGLIEHVSDRRGLSRALVRVCRATEEGFSASRAVPDSEPFSAGSENKTSSLASRSQGQEKGSQSVSAENVDSEALSGARQLNLRLLGACARLVHAARQHLPHDAPPSVLRLVEETESLVEDLSRGGGHDDASA